MPFTVNPWERITAEDIRLEPDNRVSFLVGPVSTNMFDDEYPVENPDIAVTVGPIDYPDSWPEAKLPTAPETGVTTFPRLERTLIAGAERYCFSCTFRPWADTGQVDTAFVTITRASGETEVVPATLVDGRWTTEARLGPGDSAVVARAGVTDTFGEINGQPSAVVSRPATTAPPPVPRSSAPLALPATGPAASAVAMVLLLCAGLAGRRLAHR